jgi:hypothetical protein
MKLKLINSNGLAAAAIALTFFFFSCGKDPLMTAEPKSAESTNICGNVEEYYLITYLSWEQDDFDVGSVFVSNDEDNLYVQYVTTGNWYLEELYLYVLDEEPDTFLPPGLAPFHSGDISPSTSYTFIIPFETLDFEVVCGVTDTWLKAHAAMVEIVDNEVINTLTAYGGDFRFSQLSGRWYGIIQYSTQCCDIEPEICQEFKSETAWAAGDRFTQRGNWATYTTYVSDATVPLYAGQHHEAGTVHLSAPVDGQVSITIDLNDEWYFADASENVKIQDYAAAPGDSPAPGHFDHKFTATGQTIIEVVPQNYFYGIHVEAGQWIEVDCEE